MKMLKPGIALIVLTLASGIANACNGDAGCVAKRLPLPTPCTSGQCPGPGGRLTQDVTLPPYLAEPDPVNLDAAAPLQGNTPAVPEAVNNLPAAPR